MAVLVWLYAYFQDFNVILRKNFVGYFTTLSIAGTCTTVSNCRVTYKLERILKEAALSNRGIIPAFAWKSLKETTENLREDSRCPGGHSKLAPSE
jgi:hypothetical protein